MEKEEQEKSRCGAWQRSLSPSNLQGQEARGELGSLREEPSKTKAAPAAVRAAAAKLGPVRKRRGEGGWSADGSRSAVRGEAATQDSENGVRTRRFQAWLFYSLLRQRRRGWNTPLMVTRREVSQ